MRRFASTLLVSLLLATDGLDAAWAQERYITLASASSPLYSGFFDYILPIFRSATGINVNVIAGSARKALVIGERGDADALLLHDRIDEDKFVADGFGIDRRGVMYNDYLIVGPDTDPAGIRPLKDARKAFAQIASAGALFVSRGDHSGTHRMELQLWKLAGIQLDPRSPWYSELDGGMGVTLNTAAALNAYTLTDRATWAYFNNRQHLEILTEGDPVLFRPYASILVNPAKWPHVKFSDARTWHEWLTSKPCADVIVMYRINGMQVFFPPGNGKTQWRRFKGRPIEVGPP